MFKIKTDKTKQTYKTGSFYQYGIPTPKKKLNKAMREQILKKGEY